MSHVSVADAIAPFAPPALDLSAVEPAPSLACVADERARLHALHSLGLLDTAPEPEFDAIVRLAAMICGSAVAVVQLVDADRQWSKAAFGLTARSSPRGFSFCHYAIQQPDIMIVEDAAQDGRFKNSPLVTQAGWRFYAGAPIKSPDGYAVGTLCVLDRTPRRLSAEQQDALRTLAGQIDARLILREQRQALEAALASAQVAREGAETLERRFHAFMDSGPFLAYMKDRDGRMLYYNDTLARTFAVDRQELLNRTDAELWPAKLAEDYRRNDLEVLTKGVLQVKDESTEGPDGATAVWRSYKFPCTDSAGQQLLGGISIEVTEQLHREQELKRSQEELEAANALLRELASVDSLTGLVNRRSFDEALRLAFRQSRTFDQPLSLLMLDVDHFKQHNDRFGHMHGDDVLKELARCLRATLRAGDVVARYGGEEFVMLLPGAGSTQAEALAKRVLTRIRAHKWVTAPVTVSIGVSTADGDIGTAQELVNRADVALYKAKCTGRNCAVTAATPVAASQPVACA